MGSIPTGTKLHNNLGQGVHTYVLLSPSSIIWYWSKDGDVLRLGRWPQAWRNGSLLPGWLEKLSAGWLPVHRDQLRTKRSATYFLLINSATLDPLGWPLIRCFGPKFIETVYISKVNGAMKAKSNAQVTIYNNSDLVQTFFLRGDWVGQCPNSNFSKLLEFSGTIRARKLILELQINIEKASSRGWYIGGPAKIHNPHITVLYILCEVKFKFKCL